MTINCVRYGGQTLIDLTNDTVTPETLLSGVTAHNSAGEIITGTLDIPKYIELSYIKTSGTQYIDTGFVPNQDTRVDIKYQTSDTSDATIFGVDDGWCSDAFAVFANVAEYGTGSIVGTFYGSSTITLSMNKNTITKSNSTVGSGTYRSFTCPDTLTIAALKRWDSVQELCTMTLYYCQIYDNGTLVRDFIPAMTIYGEIGLFDLVEEKFYSNAGTGSFSGSLA